MNIEFSSKHLVAVLTILMAKAVSIMNSCLVIFPVSRSCLASSIRGPFMNCSIRPLERKFNAFIFYVLSFLPIELDLN